MSENNFQNDWNHNNDWEQEQQQTYYYNPDMQTPPRPTQSPALALAAFILAVASLVTCCCGLSIFLAPLSILLAILSRGREPMSDMAKAAVGISVGVLLLLLISLLAFIVYLVTNPLEWETFLQQYKELYSTM